MSKINITKTLINCLTLFFTIQNITAQDFLPKEAPTPNAASLGKYGDIPISYPNGNISLTIPIYTMSSRGLGMTWHPNLKNLQTVTLTYEVDNRSNFYAKTFYYDTKGRIVQTHENNSFDGWEDYYYDVHVHPTDIRQDINDNTKYNYGDPRPSGSNGDYMIRRIREQNNFVSEPSWVLGTEVLLNTNPPSKGNRIITFYNSQGNISTINWNNFKRTIQKIRKQ